MGSQVADPWEDADRNRNAGSIPQPSFRRFPGLPENSCREVTKIVTKRNSTRRTHDLASDLSAPWHLPLAPGHRSLTTNFPPRATGGEGPELPGLGRRRPNFFPRLDSEVELNPSRIRGCRVVSPRAAMATQLDKESGFSGGASVNSPLKNRPFPRNAAATMFCGRLGMLAVSATTSPNPGSARFW